MHAALASGVERYTLSPGDQLRFLFTASPLPQQGNYVIGVRDRLRIEFFYHPDMTRTVVVRPDGRITLPVKGELAAAGLTAQQLADRVRALFGDILREPVVTVGVEEYSSPLSEINDSIRTGQDGRSKQIIVAPDGLAHLPLIPPVKATGKSIAELQAEVNQLYTDRVGGVAVSLSLERVAGDRVFVFGEVRNPGALTLPRPQTALQVIVAAGGTLNTGALDRVRVLSWTPDGESRVHTLDLVAALEGQGMHNDVLVPANTVIYVPPTTIAKVDRFVDQYIRQLFLFNGISANLSYQLLSRQSVLLQQ